MTEPVVLKAWRERWEEERWLQSIISNKMDTPSFADSILSLLLVGASPNPQLVRYLELGLSCGALPVCHFIRAVHRKISAEPLPACNCLVLCLSSHISTISDEADPDDPSKLPGVLLCLVEWLVRIQAHAIKQLSYESEKECISLFKGCSDILTQISESVLLRSLAPLYSASKWQSLSLTADQNIQIPLDACSDTGKKTLAGYVVAFVRSLERVGGGSEGRPLRPHVFALPCRQVLLQDLLQQGRLCTTTHLTKVAAHYRCSLERVCLELGKAHLSIMASDTSCREPLLALLLYKYPTLLAESLPSTRTCRTLVGQLLGEEPLWAQVAAVGPDWNLALPFLNQLLARKVITAEAAEGLRAGLPTEGTGMASLFERAALLLEELLELLQTTDHTALVSGLESLGRGNKNFLELADRMFYVALARGQLSGLMGAVNGLLDRVSEGGGEESVRAPLFDIAALLLLRCSMIFGAQVVPESATFARWLGSHSCGIYNPTLPVLPLARATPPTSHQQNVDALVQFLSSTSERNLDISSLKNLIIAFPDALRDTMLAIKNKVILEDTFREQTNKFREVMLVPVFVAIHWLIHFSETVEEDLRHVSKLMMKPFLKNVNTHNNSALLLQLRRDFLQKGLHSTLSLHDKKKLVKKSFWTAAAVTADRNIVETDKVWETLRTNPTLECLSDLSLFDNVSDIVTGAATQVLSFQINDDITHGILTSALFLQSDPRYVPWLFHHTIPDMLIDGLAPNFKSYIWALAKLAFISIDLYLTGIPVSGAREEGRSKRICTGNETDSHRWELLREPLAVFWGRMTCLLRSEGSEDRGITFTYQFFSRFIKCALDSDRDRLKELIGAVDRESLREGASFMIRNGCVREGLALLELSGSTLDEQAAILQTVLV